MRDLATYYDQNRLIHGTDRRLHATDMEMAGGYVQIVPAVAEKLARGVEPSALAWSHGQALQAEAIAPDEDALRERRIERWWLSEWRRREGLYRVRVLNPTERAIVKELLGSGGLPAEAFPRAQGLLRDDNDAQLVAQVIACQGRMVITSNRVLIEKRVLDEWLQQKQNRWPGLHTDKLLAEVDPLYTGWWTGHPLGPATMTRIVLAAYWPDKWNATTDEVLGEVTKAVAALERGHLKVFGGLVRERMESDETAVAEEIGKLRGNLPEHARAAERRRRAILEEGEGDKAQRVQADPGRDVMGRFEWDR